MSKPQRTTIAPDSGWQQPARTWGESIQRYVIFRQVPTWRASVKSDGSDRSPCLTASEAQALGAKMHRVLARLSPRLGKPIADNVPTAEDLTELWKRRTESRRDRCSIDLNRHFQRAFLLNAGGYACYYLWSHRVGCVCRRSGRQPSNTPVRDRSPNNSTEAFGSRAIRSRQLGRGVPLVQRYQGRNVGRAASSRVVITCGSSARPFTRIGSSGLTSGCSRPRGVRIGDTPQLSRRR
jgi:hypothetical protein